MKREAFSGIMLALLLIGILTLAFNIQPVKAEPTSWTVDDDRPADFSSIQEAINSPNVKNGDTIFVYNGTYYENVVINKEIFLVGENRDITIIDGGLTGTVVYVTAKNVRVTEFTIMKSGIGWPNSGILLNNTINVIIQNNIVVNNLHGIMLFRSSNTMLSGNKITNNLEGIELEYSNNNTLIDNIVTDNDNGGISIHLYSYNNTLIDNIASNNNWEGIFLGFKSKSTVVGNVVSNNRHGIRLFSSSKNVIADNNVSRNSQQGIRLSGVSNENIVVGNSISWSDTGIGLQESNSNLLITNTISNSNDGIELVWSSDNTIFHNNLINNIDQAIVWPEGYTNTWDDGFPSGGNYWSDYEERYPEAQELNDSGIWDTPYVIDKYNQDNYPLMEPWTPVPPIPATIDIDPDTLNLKSKGKWITAYIELPEDYYVADINVTTILLNNTIPIDRNAPTAIGDYDDDGVPDLMVKFNRQELIAILSVGEATLTITGEVNGVPFEGSDTIRVIDE